MSEERDCVVKLVDDHDVEHSVKVRAESVYEAALKGLKKLERVGWESDGAQIQTVLVEVWEEPTLHGVDVAKMLRWLKEPRRFPHDDSRKEKLRSLQEYEFIDKMDLQDGIPGSVLTLVAIPSKLQVIDDRATIPARVHANSYPRLTGVK